MTQTPLKQADKFSDAARELGCDESEAAFDAALKKVAAHKTPARRDLAQGTFTELGEAPTNVKKIMAENSQVAALITKKAPC